MQKSSRLIRTSEQKSKKQIMVFGVATLIFLVVVFKFGPSLLSQVSSIPFFKKSVTSNMLTTDNNTLETPFINSIPNATDSSSIVVTGTSSYSDAEIELYLNGHLYDSNTLSNDQKFTFQSVKLSNGTNIIKAKVKKGSEESNFTREYTVIYSQGAPKLEITSPTDEQQFTRGDQSITIQGTTDADNDIMINTFRSIVDSTGGFSYYLKLNEGDNTITITARNQAGKTTEKTLKVNYKP